MSHNRPVRAQRQFSCSSFPMPPSVSASPRVTLRRQNSLLLFFFHRLALQGFLVIAPQYRGSDGGEGKNEIGGADLNQLTVAFSLANLCPTPIPAASSSTASRAVA